MDAPDVVKAKRPRGIVRVSGHEPSSPARARVRSVGQHAAAEPGRSRDGPTPVDPQVVKPQGTASLSSPIFEEVSAMLDGLVVSGALQASEVVSAEGADLERRWYIREFARERSPDGPRKHVRRAAMVRRLVGGGRVAYWIEIEPRAYDHYRSLVFSATDAMPVEEVVKRLLEVAAERAGVWPDPAALRRLVAAGDRSGIGACAVWRHLRLEPLKPETNGPEGLGPLSADAALAEIRKVLSR